MTVLRTGSSKQYADNWAKAFGSNKKVTATKKKAKSVRKKKKVKRK